MRFQVFDAVVEIAFPNCANGPAQTCEARLGGGVTRPVAADLLTPKVVVGFRQPALGAGVAVPKAAVNEDRQVMFGQHEIGSAGKIPAVQAEPIARSMKRATNRQFGFRVRRPNAPHHPRSCLRTPSVGHSDKMDTSDRVANG